MRREYDIKESLSPDDVLLENTLKLLNEVEQVFILGCSISAVTLLRICSLWKAIGDETVLFVQCLGIEASAWFAKVRWAA